MYARSVSLQLDTERWEETLVFAQSIKDRIAPFPGLRSWQLVANRETGGATSFSVFEDEESFLAVNDQINEIVSEFREYFAGPPSEILGEVIVNLDNSSGY